MMKVSKDFTFENSLSASNLKAIALITKRITSLGVTQEQVIKMIEDYLNNKKIGDVPDFV
jgi:hypothetical protein